MIEEISEVIQLRAGRRDYVIEGRSVQAADQKDSVYIRPSTGIVHDIHPTNALNTLFFFLLFFIIRLDHHLVLLE